jgi:hypothetical protein
MLTILRDVGFPLTKTRLLKRLLMTMDATFLISIVSRILRVGTFTRTRSTTAMFALALLIEVALTGADAMLLIMGFSPILRVAALL